MGVEFEVCVSHALEEVDENEIAPEKVVMELAKIKALDVYERVDPEKIVIGADTMVFLDGGLLGKPKSDDDAFNMLSKLSGKTHQVYTGVCVVSDNDTEVFFEATNVTFKNLCLEEINEYIKMRECFDKAGAYAIQERGAVFVEKIEGDYSNVVGMPVCRLCDVLKNKFGIKIF